MIAVDIKSQLEAAGAIVLGPEPSVDRALSRMAREPLIECAVLDVNLGGEPVYPVAQALAARHIPFLFASGYQDEEIKRSFPDTLTSEKPINICRLLSSLETLLQCSR